MEVGLDALEISYRPRKGARSLSIVRHRFGPPVVNYPAQMSLDQVRETPLVRALELDLLRKYREPVEGAIGDGYRTRSCEFRFSEGEGLRLAARLDAHRVEVFHPLGTSYDSYSVQRFAFDVLKRVLRYEGEQLLPGMVAARAGEHGLRYTSVRVRDSVSVWGSCSSRGSLNFSLFALLLPDEYLDYLVWHELAHLTYMNHSESFWCLLSAYLGGNACEMDRRVNALPLSVPSLF